MDHETRRSAREIAIPVSVLTFRQETAGGPRFGVTGVVATSVSSGGGPGCTVLRVQGDTTHYLWSGHAIQLYRDAVESYYFNLVGERPAVFVICDQREDSLKPALVTLSYDDASSHMEVDEQVYSLPIPAEVYRMVEHFVLDHYVPEKKLKRKRDDWKGGETH